MRSGGTRVSGNHPPPGGGDLAASFALIARDLMSRDSVQDTLEGIAHCAVAVVTGCDWAGVMTVRGGVVESPAVTDELVAACDAEQKAAGEGPCLQVLGQREPLIRVDDLAADPRWPAFGPAAVRLGIGSMLSCELSAGPRDTAALNLYAGKPHAFDEEAAQLGQIFAIHASMAWARARLEAQLRSAVESRAGIGQAMGILMERHRVTPEQAFEMLKVASQNRNIRLRDLAEQVVLTGLDPAEMAAGPRE